MMSKEKLDKNMEYVTKNFHILLNLYRNKYILINEQEVVGSFDSYEAAANEGVNSYGIKAGFLVQFISEIIPVNFLTLAGI